MHASLFYSVCHLAGQLLKNLRQEQGELFEKYKIKEKDEMCVLIAALCHELGNNVSVTTIKFVYNVCIIIGQGPMSHLYQDLFINKGLNYGEEKWKVCAY